MKLVIDFGDSVSSPEEVVEETRRIADMLAEGFTQGQIVMDVVGRPGWWTLEWPTDLVR